MASVSTTPDETSTAGGAGAVSRPYAPSWYDYLTGWVRRLPGPAWLYYLGLWVVLSLLYTGIKWYDGTYPVGQFNSYHLVFAGIGCYTLAGLHFLDDVARQALNRFRPVLASDEKEFKRLEYRLTTLPAVPVLLITVLVVVVIFLPWDRWIQDELRTLQFGTSPLAGAFERLISILELVTGLLSIYHTIHQLLVVYEIYSHHTTVNLLKLGPLYAFSRLTALTAVLPVPLLCVEAIVTPPVDYDQAVAQVILWLVFGALGLDAFVLPMLSGHRLLEKEKERMQADIAERMESILAELNNRVTKRDWNAEGPATALKNLLDSLVTEQDLVNKVPTWPWRPELARAVGSAFLLPVALIIIGEVVKLLFEH